MAETLVAYGSLGPYKDGEPIKVSDHSKEEIDHWKAIGSVRDKRDHPQHKDYSEDEMVGNPAFGVGPAIEGEEPRPVEESPPAHQVPVNPSEVVNPAGRVTTGPKAEVGEHAGRAPKPKIEDLKTAPAGKAVDSKGDDKGSDKK